ncbi:hypothetical protein [Lactobacillus kitasatonis]|uniref:BppU N-terminal domain-containing protein n=1 Tax=Lactobacillus kitasatonis DSM 16761 = JCM 1039 TaxID=1423767 RepID=A0A0R1VM02_9LACO|nr:hypothetical protein [Lactobacillus kitasatonis]KRM06695.1 hypothetical protein FC59_GL001611 [Lactobacillus kitasatonis DSM 16761 = JCM 1039]
MTNDQLVLQVNKINISPDKTYVKYNQNERGKVLDVTVIDNDGINAYDLTNKKIRFVDDKENNKLIVDDEADNPNRFTRTNDSQGKFSYTLNDLAYQRSGIARFEIYTDADHIDATSNFEIQIENMTSTVVANESYISSLEGLVAHHRSTIDTTETETNQLIDSLNKQIAQAISDGNKSVADEVSSIKEIIQQMQTEYKSKSDALAKLTSDWQTQTQTIQNSADDQLKQINENANSEIDKLKQDADDQLKTNQENAIAALTKINQDAADQLKSNQTANDAEINSVKQQLSDELAKVETDKATAIKGVTDARDKTIQDATDKLTAKLQSVQADYDSWKTSTVSDFQAKLDKLTQQLNTDETDQASLRQAIDSAKETVSKLHDVDFTVYAHKSDLENYYTKTETDAKLAEAGKVKTVNGIQPDSVGNIAIPAPDLSGLETKADAKTANDTLDKKISDNTVAIRKNSDAIATKANASDVYTKAELDPKLADAGKVKTVNNVQPDSSGNITIPAPDLSGLETKADAKKALDAKADKTDLDSKADKTDVNNLQNKVTSQEIEIADLKKSGTKLVGVTQAQYDQLVKDGKVQQNVIYALSNS